MLIKPFDPLEDPLLIEIIAGADEDDRVLGVVLFGFRSWGWAAPDSDYDIALVMSDIAETNLAERNREELLNRWTSENVEMWITSPSLLSQSVRELVDWRIPGFAKAQVLLDKTGEVEQSLSSIRQMPLDMATAAVNGWSDAYTNALYRSIKAYRRGDELGARLHAGESLVFLTKTLFALERRWTPYHDRLFDELDSLNDWKGPSLTGYFLNLLRDPRAEVQIELFEHFRSHLGDRQLEYPPSKWNESLQRIGIV